MFDTFRKFNEILGEEKEFEKLRSVLGQYEVVEKFSEIFPDLNKVVVPVKIIKSTLYLKVENSVWRSELNLIKELVIKKINLYFKKDIVKSIKFI